MNVPAQTVQFEITDLQPTFLDYIQSQKDENTRTFNIQFLFEGDVLSLSGCTATATVTINNIMVEQELDCEVNETNNYVTVVVNAPYSGVMAVQVTLTDGTNTLTMPRPLFVRVARDIAEIAQIDNNTHGSFAEVVREVADARGNYATLAQAINAKMNVNDATVYHVDTTTQTLTYDNTNPKTIYLNARVSYGSVSNRAAVVISTSSKGYQFAITVTGDILMRSGGGTYPTDWTVLYGSSYKKNSINDDNKNSSIFIPTIGAVVSYLVANYIGNGSGTVTENNLATALKNSLYRVDNTTETVAYSADNPRTIYTNARVNGNKPTLIFTLGDDSQLAMHKDGNLYCRTYANGAYGSWIDLKATSIGESNKTSGAYPTVKAVYNFVTAFVESAISGKANTADVNAALTEKENTSDKLTSGEAFSHNKTSPEKYLSALAAYQYGLDHYTSVEDMHYLQSSLANVEAYIGYTESDILGLHADFENKVFTRLGAAVGLSAGSDFNAFPMYGQRRRVVVNENDVIDDRYSPEDITESNTNVDVMVYQPKFYYKVVPLKLEKQSSGLGYHIRKANYYISSTPHAGFKLHPLFYDGNGNEIDYVLFSAYEASYMWRRQDSTTGYIDEIFHDGVNTDTTIETSAVLKSLPGVKPISGQRKAMNKHNMENCALRKSSNWHLDTIQSVSANQLLMAIEYASFNTQSAIGLGIVSNAGSGKNNRSSLTGSTSALGNATGMASETIYDDAGTETPFNNNGKLAVSYRGMENPWGNIWKHVNGINIWGDGTMNGGQVYIADNFNFNEEVKDETTINNVRYKYSSAGFTVANTNGYISAFGYGDETYDWLFVPSETTGTNSIPVGDSFWGESNMHDYLIALLGGHWDYGDVSGVFYWNCHYTPDYRNFAIGGRLLYVPTATV